MIHRQASRVAASMFMRSTLTGQAHRSPKASMMSSNKSALFSSSSSPLSEFGISAGSTGMRASASSIFGKNGAKTGTPFRSQSTFAAATATSPPMNATEPSNNMSTNAPRSASMVSTQSASTSVSGVNAAGETESSEEAASNDDENDPSRIRQEIVDDRPGFDSLSLTPFIQNALKYRFKYSEMSSVQEKVLKYLPDMPRNLMVKARTGTGKTLAFLIAALENPAVKVNLEAKEQERQRLALVEPQRKRGSHRERRPNWKNQGRADDATSDSTETRVPEAEKIPILILSPTRELANQIAVEAARLGGGRIGDRPSHPHHRNSSPKHSASHLRVMTSFGGTSRFLNLKDFSSYPAPDVLVATPGRLVDLLQSEETARKALSNVQVLVFDEADTLLDMGFQRDMLTISKYLPKKDRQTFMFSATFDKDIKQAARELMGSSYTYVNCVPADEQESHTRIQQSYVVCPYAHQFALLHDIITKERVKNENAKILVFWQMTDMTEYARKVFEHLNDFEIMTIHSGLAQSQRQRISKAFRFANRAILFSTDVSARGVDYPNVSLVIQMGVPEDEKIYVHRIGRTARAGKEGRAILVMAPHEQGFLKEPAIQKMVEDSFLRPDLEYETPVQGRPTDNTQEKLREIVTDRLGPQHELFEKCVMTSRKIQNRFRLSPHGLSQALQSLAKGLLGLKELPSFRLSMLHRAGIRNLPGFPIEGQGRVVHHHDHQDADRDHHPRDGGFRESHRHSRYEGHHSYRRSSSHHHQDHPSEKRYRRRP